MVVRAAYGLFPIFLDTNMTLQWAHVPPFLIQQTIINPTGTPQFQLGQSLPGAGAGGGQPASGYGLRGHQPGAQQLRDAGNLYRSSDV